LERLSECFRAAVIALEREPEMGDRLADFLADARTASKQQTDCSFDVDGARVRVALPGQTGHPGHTRSPLRVMQKFASAADGPNFSMIEMNYTFICAERKRTTTIRRDHGPW